EPSFVSAAGFSSGASPSGSRPMLSGERRTWKLKGKQIIRNAQPEINAAHRQPKELMPKASNGESNAPPTGTAALTAVIARARRRMNQLFATTIGEWTKPAMKAREITPR